MIGTAAESVSVWRGPEPLDMEWLVYGSLLEHRAGRHWHSDIAGAQKRGASRA
jgi:hypothetical protein